MRSARDYACTGLGNELRAIEHAQQRLTQIFRVLQKILMSTQAAEATRARKGDRERMLLWEDIGKDYVFNVSMPS
jgi:hypothetical protein